MRVSTAYGMSQRMRFDLTVSEFTRELTLGHELEVYDADTWRPYAHVDDISEGIRMALEAPADVVAGEVFNVGGDDGNYTKRMIVEAALDALRWRRGDRALDRGRGGRAQLPGLLRQDQGRARLRDRGARCPARSRTSPRRSAPGSSSDVDGRERSIERRTS